MAITWEDCSECHNIKDLNKKLYNSIDKLNNLFMTPPLPERQEKIVEEMNFQKALHVEMRFECRTCMIKRGKNNDTRNSNG